MTAWQKTLFSRLVFSWAMRNCRQVYKVAKLWKFCAYKFSKMDTHAVCVCLYTLKFHQTQQFSLHLKPHKLTENRFMFFFLFPPGLSQLRFLYSSRTNRMNPWSETLVSTHSMLVPWIQWTFSHLNGIPHLENTLSNNHFSHLATHIYTIQARVMWSVV